MNIAEIEALLAELVKEPFDDKEFPLRLLEIYNAPKATITKLRSGTQNQGQQVGDVLWTRKLYFRPASLGQSATVLDTLKDAKAAITHKPRFLLATDGRDVAAYDVRADETLHCDYAKLNDRFDFFLPLAGVEKYEAVAENPADIKAAGRLAKLHDEIERINPEWLEPAKRHTLNQFLTRILFCMFAQSTGGFAQDLFVKTVSEFGGADGEELQSLLKQIFDVMNEAEDNRDGIAAHIRAFPYVNGGLFAEAAKVPVFNRRAKRMLVEAAQLDWKEINPDIFGSMIQAVVDTEMRGDLGMHYTSVPNIMKVLQPLFLMSLEEEFERARGHREERSLLRKLLTRISKIRVFDPACGSGNFLIIAYRELRTLEMRVFQRLDEISGGTTTWREQTAVKLSNFYGIELADFAAETAKLSLWIAEYQMNQRFKNLFGEAPKSFPLREGGHIVCGNALRMDWLRVCPEPLKAVQKEKVFDLARVEKVQGTVTVVDEDAETFLVGNPPYLGGKKLTEAQESDMELVFGSDQQHKNLDYICGFFRKAVDFVAQRGAAAFVATTSINQGTHVPTFWPYVLNSNVELAFFHEPFHWSNNAAKKAGVTCTILGLRRKSKEKKLFFTQNDIRPVRNINPYLVDASDLIVEPSQSPLFNLPRLITGNAPYDGGYLILSPKERSDLLKRCPPAERFLLRCVGTSEFVDGLDRWCLWIDDHDAEFARGLPAIADRIDAVLGYRRDGGEVAQTLLQCPHRFRYTHRPLDAQILVPQVSSHAREYIPVGLLDRSTIVTHLAFAIYEPNMQTFAVLNSKMHNVWMRALCGRMRKDFRYSTTIVYNTFPAPTFSPVQIDALEQHAWQILATRGEHPGKTIAWLYDPQTMPTDLREAHQALDETLEKIYVGRSFKSDMERLEHLFRQYEERIAASDLQGAARA
ncbi:MAG: hypothetical protein B7Y80_16835 [Hyphomicrobium sp. 32-62-53]|nr:MAG: hypothetical protein B7Z29_07940 [Hyphomicrobium sp. 12-62-95]OYX98042.1 MAG: hypothetical protein B7Y80_16835 [Hyphomicrobium sp. 32-62-53]